MALSLVLLVCAGLTIRSLQSIQGVDLGFRRDHLLTLQLSMSPQRYAAPQRTRAFYRQVLECAASLPGVRAASLAMGQAPWDTPEATAFGIAGQPPAGPGQMRAAALERVSPEYFRALAIGMAAGRAFTARDDETAPPVAVVNRTFAAMYFPHDQPLRQRILLQDKSWEIVGVAGDVKFGGPEANPVPMLYLPMIQSPAPNGSLALLTSADPLSLAQTLRAALARIDPDTPASRLKTMDRIALDSMAQPRVETGLFATFGAVALFLAALGVYGVVSFSVAQGTHDIGIRMALGAGRCDILRLVLSRALALSAMGLLAGLGAALALTRVLSTLLFHVKPTDPATFVCVSLVLLAVALAASLIPARRATRIDPAAALRAE